MKDRHQGPQTTPTPVTVLTGFLGAGKTTLLNHVLSEARGFRIAVLVNDFGNINIDSRLIAQVGQDQIALSNGCICCTIRDDLLSALVRLLQHQPAPQHVIIEASGLSDPTGIAETLLQPYVESLYSIDAMVAVCDAHAYAGLSFQDTEMVLHQAAVADLVLLNKTDIAAPESLALLRRDIAIASPRARMIETDHSKVPWSVLLDVLSHRSQKNSCSTLCQKAPYPAHVSHHKHDQTHAERYESWSWSSSQLLNLERFRSWIRHLSPSIYRAKGIVRFGDQPNQPCLFQLVGKRSSLSVLDMHEDIQDSTVVLIGLRGDYTQQDIEKSLTSCLETTASTQGAIHA